MQCFDRRRGVLRHEVGVDRRACDDAGACGAGDHRAEVRDVPGGPYAGQVGPAKLAGSDEQPEGVLGQRPAELLVEAGLATKRGATASACIWCSWPSARTTA